MLFEKIYIRNLFSYYGEAVFDLTIPENKGNIVIISGRNGYGKTSFINSVKLLFGGPNESLRTLHTGFRLSEKLYILGHGEKWIGIMNRRAYEEGQTQFGIQIHWREEAGAVNVNRSWLLSGKNSYEPRLYIKTSFLEEDLEGEKAQAFLNERLPQDYIPYFFFDCEQIQVLAEDNQKAKLEQMERILNIAKIDILSENIGFIERQLKKDAMVGQANLELTKLENKKKELAAQQIDITEKKKNIEDELIELDERIKDEEHYLDSIRDLNAIKNEDNLREKYSHLQQEIGETANYISEKLPLDAPLLVNLPLVRNAICDLRKLIESKNEVQHDILKYLQVNLPSVLEMPPCSNPPLTENQIQFYKKRLIQYISVHTTDTEDILDTTINIEKKRAELLLDKFLFYEQADILRIEMRQKLRHLSQKKNELYQIEQDLENVSTLSTEIREEYERRRAENNDRMEQRGRHKANIEKLENDIRLIEKESKNIDQEIHKKQSQVKLSREAHKKVELAKKLKEYFKDYKNKLKNLRRDEIERSINDHLKKLMTSHSLLYHIRVEDDFSLCYENSRKNPIGMGNLSAGMKQLIATSLLWALKDVSGKTVPLIIDTPLARIDREHQENLLQNYYPYVGKQVIILPTDSELDEKKYSIIKPYVYNEYILKNLNGETTEIKRLPMYPSE